MFILCFTGILPSRLELIGVLVAVIGCMCMLVDPQAARANGESGSISAAVIDIGSAVFGSFYFLLSARNVKNIPICFLIFIMNLHTFMLNSFIAKI